MNFFGIKNSMDEFRHSYSLGDKAKAAAKIVGIATANTAIFVCNELQESVERKKEQLEKEQRKKLQNK
ncbi:hypothetical protein D3C87_122050 [compost metagenome]